MSAVAKCREDVQLFTQPNRHVRRTLAKCGDHVANKRPHTFAFTLIEILTVIAILVVVAAVLFPALFAAKRRGLETRDVQQLRQIGFASLLYRESQGGDPPYWNVLADSQGLPLEMADARLDPEPRGMLNKWYFAGNGPVVAERLVPLRHRVSALLTSEFAPIFRTETLRNILRDDARNSALVVEMSGQLPNGFHGESQYFDYNVALRFNLQGNVSRHALQYKPCIFFEQPFVNLMESEVDELCGLRNNNDSR
jgi:type II secretory pathway pseudopilin PulG